MGKEKVLGVVPEVVKVGITRQEFDLVFTDKRLIWVKQRGLTSYLIPMIEIKSHLESAKKLLDKEQREYKEKTPQEILGAHKDNFAVNYSDIKEVEVKSGFVSGYRLIIKTASGDKHHYGYPRSWLNELKDLVKRTLGNKLVS